MMMMNVEICTIFEFKRLARPAQTLQDTGAIDQNC